jgi:ribosome maturation factor RimP
MKDVERSLEDRIGSIVNAMGYEFVGLELQRQGKYSLLRIYIDSENGIKVDDCSKVSYQVSAMLDVEDPISGQYTLEVSSPGLNRPLFTLEQYKKFIGSEVKIKLRAPIKERRNFAGTLLRVEGVNIHLLSNAEEIVLPFSTIEKANIVAEIRM